jgi:hypothetical protein
MKNKLVLENACSYRGADMGRANRLPEDLLAKGKLRVTRLKWVDGDYDEFGAYWGNTGKDDVYCAWGDIGETAVRIFVRADARDVAKHEVNNVMPNVSFYR